MARYTLPILPLRDAALVERVIAAAQAVVAHLDGRHFLSADSALVADLRAALRALEPETAPAPETPAGADSEVPAPLPQEPPAPDAPQETSAPEDPAPVESPDAPTPPPADEPAPPAEAPPS
jgi:hypothetical protein